MIRAEEAARPSIASLCAGESVACEAKEGSGKSEGEWKVRVGSRRIFVVPSQKQHDSRRRWTGTVGAEAEAPGGRDPYGNVRKVFHDARILHT